MARTETVVLICDDPRHFDEVGAATSRRLAVDGNSYELDLCVKHDEEYQAALAPFLASARRAVPAPATRQTPHRPMEARRRTAAIRTWWRDHPVPGVTYTDRGRISSAVLAAYGRRA